MKQNAIYAPDHTGELTALPSPSSCFQGAGGEPKGSGRERQVGTGPELAKAGPGFMLYKNGRR